MSYFPEQSLNIKRRYKKFQKSLRNRPQKSAYTDILKNKNNQIEEVNIYIRKKRFNYKLKNDRPLSHYINDNNIKELLDGYHRQDVRNVKMKKIVKYKNLDDRYLKDSKIQKKMRNLFFQQEAAVLERNFVQNQYGSYLNDIYQNDMDIKWQKHLSKKAPQFKQEYKRIDRKYKPLITAKPTKLTIPKSNTRNNRNNRNNRRYKRQKQKKQKAQTFFIINQPKNQHVLKEFKYRQKLSKKKLGIDYIQLRKVMEKNGVIFSPTLEKIKQQANFKTGIENKNLQRKRPKTGSYKEKSMEYNSQMMENVNLF